MLPEPLAGLVLRLADTRQGHAATGDQGTSPWLLPGGRPGQPISPCQLGERLRQIGIRPAQGPLHRPVPARHRTPAAILARMLGIHIDVAVAWQRISAGDWMTYAADVSRRESKPGAVPSRHQTPAGHEPGRPLPGLRETCCPVATGSAADASSGTAQARARRRHTGTAEHSGAPPGNAEPWSAPASLEAPKLADLPIEYHPQALYSRLPHTFSEAYPRRMSGSDHRYTTEPSQP